ncbi:MAG: SUMF1/EgtB/PvdO family nonheme iron enzyme [Methyloprofundus sp.]|nr:SUMF1/EgtB/PvdO family nonheme iron enzyme [Methyloprofundus sp.]
MGRDRYGLYAELDLFGITQRFRYIEAGTFMMGSPSNEAGRYEDEDYHQVTLNQGYWLADTACTQALWDAVMGDNPAEFTGDSQNPVETVSWLDVQNFLQKLNEKYTGLQAQLPSEAQWEYACRAGTVTPFSWGENITPEQVNYDGTEPYAGAEKGEVREKTVVVKSFAANQWGLYEMHGNVWEWCLDEWNENLGTEPVSDPVNFSVKSESDEGVSRVLRGGSWIGSGRDCRSAVRFDFSADFRRRDFGFRFSLGHQLPPSTVSRSAENSSASEQLEHDPARRGAVQGHDQAGSGVSSRSHAPRGNA